MNIDFSGLFFAGIFISLFCLTVVAVILKTAGVLLLSWWWVLSPLPLALLVTILIFGICALLDR